MAAKSPEPRVGVAKTYKLFIGGKLPRTESGRTMTARDAKGGFVANICRASRKDFRDAAQAARKAHAGWSARTAFNRGQILYRMAEMLEARAGVFEAMIQRISGRSATSAGDEVRAAVDRLVWSAGWTDKFSQVFGAVNPVATSHFNFTTPESMGVVAVFVPRQAPLLGLVTSIAPILVPGNTTIAIVDTEAPTIAIEFAEVLATSDLPGGVVNILTGTRDELTAHVGKHMDVDGVACYDPSDAERKGLGTDGAETVKRVHFFEGGDVDRMVNDDAQSPYRILPFVEFKTAWHPIGV